MSIDLQETVKTLSRGTELILPLEDLEEKLGSGKKLKVKFGMDPTAPDLHLGHTVVLSKLKEFQDLGHEIIVIIGDFTARIGDPSGRSKTRPKLTVEQIKENAKTYFEQVGRVLDIDKIQVRYNAEWLQKLSFEDFLQIAGRATLARIIERDDFQKRLIENQPIGLHELFYPLLQAYDSVVLDADIELGGNRPNLQLAYGKVSSRALRQRPSSGGYRTNSRRTGRSEKDVEILWQLCWPC